MGFMNARRLTLAAVVSLSTFTAGALLVAPAALAEELCPNAAARQGPSSALPDCRAYEQVTPVDKGDSEDLFPSEGLKKLGNATPDAGYAAEDGEHVLLNTAASFAGGDAFTSSYVFSRGAEGWTTTALSPGPGVHEVEAAVFDPADLSAVGFDDLQLNHLPGQPEERVEADVAGAPGGPYSTLDSVPSHEAGADMIAGASANLDHVVVESVNHALAPGDSGQDEDSRALYEWSGGQPRLVNVDNEGSLLSLCGAILGLGGIYDNSSGDTQDAVSSDGSKVFFTAPDPDGEGPGCWTKASESHPQENPPQLYMRLNGSSTIEISAPDPGVHDPDGPQPVIYAGASKDGSKVFFLSGEELTADDTTHALELYEYDTEAPAGERLVRVSSGESGSAEGDVDFVGAISSDGSTVYFSAYGKLAQGASALNGNGREVNLYRYSTATRKTTYITKLNYSDYPLNNAAFARWYPLPLGANHPPEVALLGPANWYTTADGQYLVFGSYLPLTGYNNMHSPSVTECLNLYNDQEPTEGRCAELYRYDAATNSITCVSCGPAGVQPTENAEFIRDTLFAPATGPQRPISEDGSYVFFETTTALVPNTTSGTLHVYEWHNGKISLISSAGDPANAYFLGSSANGSNVFFGTHAQLVPQDTDVGGDLYDARIDGGFVKPTPAQCTGTGCQGVPAAPPIFATPASVTFEGVGNFPPGVPAKAKPRARSSTSAQKLAKALRVCDRDRAKRKRARCEASARARYGKAGRKAEKSKNAGRGN
jgi:hypothetical protein